MFNSSKDFLMGKLSLVVLDTLKIKLLFSFSVSLPGTNTFGLQVYKNHTRLKFSNMIKEEQ